MLTSDRLSLVESILSKIANDIHLPDPDELEAVRGEIFNAIEEDKTEVERIANLLKLLDNAITQIEEG